MSVEACLLFDETQNKGVRALNPQDNGDAYVIPRKIDNPMADQLGLGAISGDHYVAPARLLNDPDYTGFVEFCSQLPIYTWDSDVLFLPDPGI